MNDTISRQAAINVLKRKQYNGNGYISRFYNTIIQHDIEAIEQLPPTQPEIIRCKDCKHLFNKDDEGGKCWHFNGFSKVVSYDDFCSLAERREVTE